MTLYTRGSDGFVSSTAAPIASEVERTQFPGGTLTRSRPVPFHGARVIEIDQQLLTLSSRWPQILLVHGVIS